MSDKDVRRESRFDNYKRSLAFLSKFIQKDQLNELESLGSIKSFSVTCNIAEQLLFEYTKSQDISNASEIKEVVVVASKRGLINKPNDWLEMISARNQTNDTYQAEIAEKVATDIREKFFDLLLSLQHNLQTMQNIS